jgi:FMN-dependent NADH-azoreductase
MNGDGSYTGLLSGKKATVIIASAGEYGPDAPAEGLDTLKPYLREILGFIGVTDVAFRPVSVGCRPTILTCTRSMATIP